MSVNRRNHRRVALLMLAALMLSLIRARPALALPAQPSQAVPVSVAASGSTAVAVRADGSVWGWGDNQTGALGDGTTATTVLPARLSALDGITAVAAGVGHSLGLSPDGTVIAWGSNSSGQVGDGAQGDEFGQISGTARQHVDPVPVTGLSGVIQVAAAGSFSLALKGDGTVWAWGDSLESGSRGDGIDTARSTPAQVPGLPAIKYVAAARYQSLAIGTDGSVWQWGQERASYQSPILKPHKVAGLSGVTAAAAGLGFAIALKADGTVWAWGENDHGQLGNGGGAATSQPVQVSGLTNVTAVTAAYQYALALKADGSVWAWGRNENGQMGNGTKTDAVTPVAVSGLTGVIALDAGDYAAVAMTADGDLWAWGSGSVVGDGAGWQSRRLTPYRVQLPADTAAPTWPAGSKVTVGSNSVSWTPAAHAEGVYRYHVFVDGNPVALVGGDTHYVLLKTLRPGRTYTVAVRAQSRTGAWTAADLTGAGSSRYGFLAAGGSVSAALRPDGTVFTWGDNRWGQLGVGHQASSAVPVRTHAISDATMVATNGDRTMALRTDGTVWEWGAPSWQGPAATEPVQVAGLTDVISIAARSAGSPAYALRADGTLWTWYATGAPGGVTQRQSPFRFVAMVSAPFMNLGLTEAGQLFSWQDDGLEDGWGLSNVATMAAGLTHALAVKGDGTVWAWGDNEHGQLGNGTTLSEPYAVQVSGLDGVIMVAAGVHHSLALKADGTVWAWGENTHGSLGDGTETERHTPVQVRGISGAVAIAAGPGYSLAMQADGSVWAWGDNLLGRLGDGTEENRLTPVQTQPFAADEQAPVWPDGSGLTFSEVRQTGFTVDWPAAADKTAIASYRVFVQDALRGELAQRAMGINGLYPGKVYQVAVTASDMQGNWSEKLTGTITTADLSVDTPVHGLTAGDYSAFATTDDGLWMWGGDPGLIPDALGTPGIVWDLPVRLTEPENIAALSGGFNHLLALRTDGTVLAWGSNDNGQLGNGSFGESSDQWTPPAPVPGMTDVKQIAALTQYSVALKKDGTVWSWGYGYDGELGDGTTRLSPSPVRASGLTDVVAIASNSGRTLALKNDGTVWGWGANHVGQVGDGSTTNRLVPVQVAGLRNVIAIAAGPGHSLALTADGTVWGWGSNAYGQLGYWDWAESNRLTPVQVPQLSGVTAVAAGAGHSVALRADGSIWTWGQNNSGQLGDGTFANRFTPNAIPELTARAVAAGSYHTLAVRTDNTAWAWGANFNGHLGTGTVGDSPWPLPVQLPAADTAAPAWGQRKLAADEVERTSLSLTWQAPDDSSGVAFYRIYQDGNLIGTVPRHITTFPVKGLTAGTDYHFQVQARDAWGNWGTDGPILDVRTAAPDGQAPALVTGDDGKPRLDLGMLLNGEWGWTRPKTATVTTLTYAAQKADKYALHGEMNEPVGRVVINGKQVEAEMDGNSFSVLAPIKAGSSATLTVEVYDLTGNKAVLPKVQVQADTALPTLSITSPEQAVWGVNGYTTISGTTSEEVLTVLIWDEDDQRFREPDALTVSGKTFRATVELRARSNRWVDGETYRLRLIAVDYALNFSKADARGADRRTFVADATPPGAPVVTSPTFPGGTLTTTQKMLTVTGQAAASTVAVKAAPGTEDDWGTSVAVKPDAKGAFTLNVPLPEGVSTLRVWGEDWAGNPSDTLMYTVTRDSTAPVLAELRLRVRRGADWSTLDWVPKAKGGYGFSLPGADAYVLEGAFGESLGALTVNGKSNGVSVSENAFTAELSGVKNGSNALTVTVRDMLGNAAQIAVSIDVDATAPAVTVSVPKSNLLLGASLNQTPAVGEFSGTATEALRALRAVDASSGAPLTLETEVKFDAKDPKKWTARIAFPTDSPAQWAVRFEGQDVAGNWSVPDKQGKDRRTVTVDPVAPVVTLLQDLPDVIYTNGNNGGLVKGKLTISGTASDATGALQRVVIGRTTLTPPKGKEKQFDFSTAVALTDGAVTPVEIYAQDTAGNLSTVKRIIVVYQSKVNKLSVTAKWARSAQTLTISGLTSPAFKVDDRWVGLVPLTVTITDKQGKLIETFALDASSVAGYDFARGTFTINWKSPADLPSGKYTVSVTAKAPDNMPWVASKTVTASVNIQR